ncbi:MAG: ABC transporter ATP-binding protein [Protaetiibacter sp.]
MESEPATPTTTNRRPSGSAARRGSASAASRARTGASRVDPPRPEAAIAGETETDAATLTIEAPVEVGETDVPEAPRQLVETPTPKRGPTPRRTSKKGAAPAAEPDAAPADEAQTEAAPETEAAPGESDVVVAPAPPPSPRGKRRPVRVTAPESPAAASTAPEVALSVEGLSKYFGGAAAVDAIDLEVAPGAFFGIVGPNGAGKTTTLSMVTGLLRPDAGIVRVFGLDVWQNAQLAKRQIGVLPDRLRLFDRLTGAEFLYHAGALRGLDRATIAQRSADLSAAFGLEHSLHRLVSDYSAGMTKKIAIAAAMIHAPRLLVLDEPFESVDPVSAAVVIGVLKRFTAAGGTVILSSHSMELTERVCDGVAIIAEGSVLAAGPLAEVLDGRSLEERFVELAGGEAAVEDMEWLQNFSD